MTLGGGRGDHRLDQAPQVEQLLEGGPVGRERALHARLRLGTPRCQHECPAVPSAPDLDVARLGQAVQRLAHACAVDRQQGGELALARQALARDVLAECDRRDESIGDVLARVAQVHRRERRAALAGPPEGDVRHASSPCSQVGIRRLSVRAPAAMLATSTASSTACRLRPVGP